MDLDLAVVMPVYNEEACIVEVLQSWNEAIACLGASYQIIVLNDGSTDRTAEKLAPLAGKHVVLINKKNSGHGPTILQGYGLAVDRADWVFQCDSDDEMKPQHFAQLWKERNHFDALFGYRAGRVQGHGRRLISVVSRLTVRLLFGKGVRDVNTPYRLMRATLLKEIIRQIPASTFAPNIIISGALAKSKARIFNLPVPHEGRRTGAVSIVKWKLWKAAFQSFWQTLRCRPDVALLQSPQNAARRAA
jgi:glycosyltransferase involved in cell wall biosynthesis